MDDKDKDRYRNRHPNLRLSSFFSDEAFSNILNTDKHNIIRAACGYAIAIVPENQQPTPVIPTDLQSELSPPTDYNIPLLNLLFTNPAYRKDAKMLVDMWRVAAGSLQSLGAKELGRELRESFRALHKHLNPLERVAEIDKLEPTWRRIQNELSQIVLDAVVSDLPHINHNIVENFVRKTCLGVGRQSR